MVKDLVAEFLANAEEAKARSTRWAQAMGNDAQHLSSKAQGEHLAWVAAAKLVIGDIPRAKDLKHPKPKPPEVKVKREAPEIVRARDITYGGFCVSDGALFIVLDRCGRDGLVHVRHMEADNEGGNYAWPQDMEVTRPRRVSIRWD
jgi:hypothetical protein